MHGMKNQQNKVIMGQALNNIRESIDNKIELPAENDLLENKTEEEIYALAQAGNAEAQTLIGLTYMTNGSLANNEDDKKAFHWLSLAADQNYPQALMWVASYYQNGGRGNWLQQILIKQ
jgi:TPR repeat protein